MITMTPEPTQYAPRFRMPVGAFAHTAVPCAGVDLRVTGTSVSVPAMPAMLIPGIAASAARRNDAFDTPGVRCWSPPV